MHDLTPDQVKDIQEREKKGLEALEALNLTPAAVVHKVNMGDDVFGDKLIPYLRDTKYAKKEAVVSPIQNVDPKKD